MTSKNVDIAREYFEAVQKGDLVRVGELLDEEIVWHQPGANQFSGERKGRDAVFAMLGGMMEASQGSFAIDKIDVSHGQRRHGGRFDPLRRGARGRVHEHGGVDVLRLKDGKIVEMWLFSGDQVAEDAF
jgi:ketosteroid isomerase-like protein